MKLWQIMYSLSALSACAQTGGTAEPTPAAPPPIEQGAARTAAKRPSDPGGIIVKSKFPAYGTFSGVLAFKDKGCEVRGECIILDKAFRFKGSDIWAVRAKYPTDGASIPKFAQDVIGKPFDPSYLPAAVIHDNYCTHKVRSFLATHRAFYEMLRALGISEQKAKIMYAGVLIGGPKWIELEKGGVCGAGCIRTLSDGTTFTKDGPNRKSQNTQERAGAFNTIGSAIKSNPNLSLDEIDAQAQLLLPPHTDLSGFP